MDAWRNGGTFEGKKATDDMVLKFWQGEAKDLDKNDPNYEEAKNNIMQLQYGIAQSKADVLHAQGKLSDNAYAQFFLSWAKKVPANSEFYRTLQKDAAQLIESSKASSRAAGERAKTEAFNKFVQTTTDSQIAIGDAMTAALTAYSKETGLSITGNGDELLAGLTKDVAANPNEYRRLLDTIHKADPHFDGNLTENYFSQHIKSAVQGYDLIADRAQKAGYVSAYASAVQGQSSMAQWGQNVKLWPVAETYSTIMNTFSKVMNDPNASQMDKTSAAESAAAALGEAIKTPGIDAGSVSMITADAARLLGQDGGDSPSFGQAMLSRDGVSPQISMQLGSWQATKQQMLANPTAFAYAPVDANGQFDPTGRGALGIVPAGSVAPGAQAVMVPGSDGKAVMAMVMPHSIYTVDPNNPNGSPKLAGYSITYNVGGKQNQLWGYKDEHDQNHWRLTSPLTEGATTQVDNKGDIYVSPPAGVGLPQQIASLKDSAGNPLQLTAEQQASLVAGGSITAVTDTSAKGKAGVKQTITVSVKDGYLASTTKSDQIDATGSTTGSTTTPSQLTSGSAGAAFSPSVLAAGNQPGVTFDSPMQASVKAAAYTQTQDQVSKYASDPAFQAAFLKQTMETLGIQNPYDPRIASAWKDVTTASHVGAPDPTRGPISAAERADLRYPGATANPAAYASKVEVNFGGQSITIPGLPSYLKDQNINLGGGSSAAAWATASPWANLLPGLGLPQQPQGSPAPVITPKPVSATPTATPAPASVTPTPTPAPTSAPAPTPYPRNKPI